MSRRDMMREKLEALAKEWDKNYDPYVMMDPTSHLHAEAVRAILAAEPEPDLDTERDMHWKKRAYDTLAQFGVPFERARSIANGIRVLAARYEKELSSLRASLEGKHCLCTFDKDGTHLNGCPLHGSIDRSAEPVVHSATCPRCFLSFTCTGSSVREKVEAEEKFGAGYDCPICGKNTPHEHTEGEVEHLRWQRIREHNLKTSPKKDRRVTHHAFCASNSGWYFCDCGVVRPGKESERLSVPEKEEALERDWSKIRDYMDCLGDSEEEKQLRIRWVREMKAENKELRAALAEAKGATP